MHHNPHRPAQALDQLTPAERQALADLADRPARVNRADVIQEQGVEQASVHLLVAGWAASAVLLPDGRQQIVRLHLPGDLLGLPSLALQTTAECITALTAATVARVPLHAVAAMLAAVPRLPTMLFLWAQREQVALMDALTAIGRTPAKARVAAFLLQLSERVAAADLGDGSDFALPLTQDQFGDLAGLSTVHVNRSVQQLRDAGLIGWRSQRVTILDRDGLAALSCRPERVPCRDAAWLRHAPAPPAA